MLIKQNQNSKGLASNSSSGFLCKKVATSSELRPTLTMDDLNKRLNECAESVIDGSIFAVFSSFDAEVLRLKYLSALYNRERAHLAAKST